MPDVTELALHDGDEFLVVASDGLWDVLDSQVGVGHAGQAGRSTPVLGRAVGVRSECGGCAAARQQAPGVVASDGQHGSGISWIVLTYCSPTSTAPCAPSATGSGEAGPAGPAARQHATGAA